MNRPYRRRRNIHATEDYSYNQHLIKISWKDAKYVLSNLNESHKTVGMGGAGDPGYYVSEFEEATPGFLWASSRGLDILDENGITYEEVKKAVNSSTRTRSRRSVKASYADYLDTLDGGSNDFDPGEIYEIAVETLPPEDISHHESDLYLRKTPESTALIKRMRYRNSGLLSTFRSQIDGDIWYELPFCYGFDRLIQERQRNFGDNITSSRSIKASRPIMAMEVYELRDRYLESNPDGHFFDKETLKFFGERWSDMKVSKDLVDIKDYRGNVHTCYELVSKQRNAPGGTRTAYHYFDKDTFDLVYPE